MTLYLRLVTRESRALLKKVPDTLSLKHEVCLFNGNQEYQYFSETEGTCLVMLQKNEKKKAMRNFRPITITLPSVHRHIRRGQEYHCLQILESLKFGQNLWKYSDKVLHKAQRFGQKSWGPKSKWSHKAVSLRNNGRVKAQGVKMKHFLSTWPTILCTQLFLLCIFLEILERTRHFYQENKMQWKVMTLVIN